MKLTTRRLALAAGLIIGLGAVALAAGLSLAYGAADIRLADVLTALTQPGESNAHVIIRTVRVPRALIAAGVGASLAVAGALMQALTGNPLASPGILGINAGGALAVVLALFVLKAPSLSLYAWFAFGGAAAAAGLVYGLAALGKGRLTPLRLTISGAAVSALFASLTQGILLVNERTLDEIRFWMAGSVAGRDPALLAQVAPYMGAGLLLALFLGGPVTTMTLGDDVAKGLGQRTAWVKAGAGLAVVLLAGASVAVAGPVGFVGLAVPHIVRALVGTDYRWILPYCALVGAALLLLADVGARFLIRPEEAPVGVVTALLGAPFFIYLARREAKWK